MSLQRTCFFPMMIGRLGLFIRTGAALLAALLVFGSRGSGQTSPVPGRELSDGVAEQIGKLRPLVDEEDYAGALGLLEGALTRAAPGSYDAAVLWQIKAQIHLVSGSVAEAIEPLERALAFDYFEEKPTLEMLYYLAQLYYQEGDYNQAGEQMRRWLARASRPRADALLFYASVLFGEGRHDEAIEQADRALRLSPRPNEQLYLLKLACLQTQERHEEAARLLELLSSLKPENATYWNQLLATYLALGRELSAVSSLLRAQERGVMTSPKDYLNLVSLYYNLEEFARASRLLEAGLRDGRIQSEQKNWELLAYCWMQLNRPERAVGTLREAARRFPESGNLDVQLAQMLYDAGDPRGALASAEQAVGKGGLDRPGLTLLFLANVAFELEQMDKVAEALDRASEYPDVAQQVRDFRSAIAALEEANPVEGKAQ